MSRTPAMTKRTYFGCPLLDGCFGCNRFPHRLPPAQKIVDLAFAEFTAKYKFSSFDEHYEPTSTLYRRDSRDDPNFG